MDTMLRVVSKVKDFSIEFISVDEICVLSSESFKTLIIFCAALTKYFSLIFKNFKFHKYFHIAMTLVLV